MTAIVGLFGKLPAHGDFVRRGLPGAVVAGLDDWLQTELSRAADPSAVIAAMPPVRFASTALLDGYHAVGVMVSSSDSVGRDFPLVAVALSGQNDTDASDASTVGDCDVWSAAAEAALIEARDGGLSADQVFAGLVALPATTGGASAELPRGEDFDRLIMQRVA